MADYITAIRTTSGDKQIDYNALANLPDNYTNQEVDEKIQQERNYVDSYMNGDKNAEVFLTKNLSLIGADSQADFEGTVTVQPPTADNHPATKKYVDDTFLTEETDPTVPAKISEHNTSGDAHNDVRLLISDLNTRLNALANSEDVDLDQMAELVAYIKDNRELIEQVTTNKVSVSDIVDNLTTNVSNKPLSAAQGVILKGLIDSIAIPTRTSQLTNDSGFLTQHQDISGLATRTEIAELEETLKVEIENDVSVEVAEQLANKTQLAPEFADSIEGCTDTSKLYVLPDGYIYAYMYKEGGKELYTNLAKPNDGDWKSNSRLNASGAIASSNESGAVVSNAFACKQGDILRVKGLESTTTNAGTGAYLALTLLNSSGDNVQGAKSLYLSTVKPPSGYTSSLCMGITPVDGVYEYVIGKNNQNIWIAEAEAIVSARVGGIAINGVENVIVTINEEIATSASGYEWANTGHAFVPTDYEDRIIILEREAVELQEHISAVESQLESKENATESNVKWCAMGDSITEGWVSYLNDSGSPTSKVDRVNGWAAKVAGLNGWELTNKAIGGTGYIDLENSDTEGVTAAWYIARNTDFTPFNLVTLAYGVNDWKGNKILGTINDATETPTTIYAGIKATIEAILASNPRCKIVVLTPLNCAGYDFNFGTEATNWGLSKSFSNNGTLETIYEAIVAVCEYYGIEHIDMTHKSVVNRKNMLQCLTDGIHPNAETHTLLAHELAKKLPFGK